MTITENLYLTVSNIVDIRVTPENLRIKMEQLSGIGGITSQVKTAILIELLLAVADLDKKTDDTK